MPVKSISREAYGAHARQGKPPAQLARIEAALDRQGAMTRQQLAHVFSSRFTAPLIAPGHPDARGTWDGGPPIPLASVCGRVNAVLEDPFCPGSTRPDKFSGRRDPARIRVVREVPGPRGHDVEVLDLIRPTPAQCAFAWQ